MDWVNKFLELFNSTTKLMKAIIYIIALSMAVMMIYFTGSMIFGKHVKIFGIEVNIPKQEASRDSSKVSFQSTVLSPKYAAIESKEILPKQKKKTV